MHSIKLSLYGDRSLRRWELSGGSTLNVGCRRVDDNDCCRWSAATVDGMILTARNIIFVNVIVVVVYGGGVTMRADCDLLLKFSRSVAKFKFLHYNNYLSNMRFCIQSNPDKCTSLKHIKQVQYAYRLSA